MWDEIFDDPEEFADYYFTEICKQNKILLAYKGDVLAGMIHLNPYEMQVEGKKELCYYIVGVAVKPEYREQGIMHKMMQRVLADMKKDGRAFAFLMPEREEYYESLGFEKVFHTLELDIDIAELEDENVVPDDLSGEEGYYTKNLKDLHEERADILEHLSGEVNEALAKKYRIYAHRTGQLPDLLATIPSADSKIFLATDGLNGYFYPTPSGLVPYDGYASGNRQYLADTVALPGQGGTLDADKYYPGMSVWDSSLGKPKWWTGSGWWQPVAAPITPADTSFVQAAEGEYQQQPNFTNALNTALGSV